MPSWRRRYRASLNPIILPANPNLTAAAGVAGAVGTVGAKVAAAVAEEETEPAISAARDVAVAAGQ